jgi:hypothetical protein
MNLIERLESCGVKKNVAEAIEQECAKSMATNSARIAISTCCNRGTVTVCDLRRILEEAPGVVKHPAEARRECAENGMTWEDFVSRLELDTKTTGNVDTGKVCGSAVERLVMFFAILGAGLVHTGT